jgi:AraC-like DNA-binding protein/mannose-6-phosphate isomerase-like protein (cupin superfamily)
MVRADIERFAIDQLIAADQEGSAQRSRTFAVQVPDLTSVPVHWHDYYELGYVLEGRALHVVNGVEQHLSPGCSFLLSPADFHALEAVGRAPLRVVNAVLHPQLVESVLDSVLPSGDTWLPWSSDGPTHNDAASDAGADVRRLCDELSARRPGWDVLVESLLRGLVVGLARSCGHPGPDDGGGRSDSLPTSASAPGVRRAVRFVEQHFREPLTLAQVAAVAHLSPHWFSTQFRLATGDSFQAYLKRRRLQFARALLDSTDLGVTEVCHAAGFNDASYFGRAYRACYGVSPSGRSTGRSEDQEMDTFSSRRLDSREA